MAAIGIQLAAYFTYTPYDLGEYNPGWIVEPLNLYYTPTRAAAFRAGGELFRQTPVGAPIPQANEEWIGENWKINSRNDAIELFSKDGLFYSNGTELILPNPPKMLMGRGDSSLIRSKSNGCYFLEKISDEELRLEVLPNQFFTSDPFRGKSFRSMSNRYVDINRECVVSRLSDLAYPMEVHYPGFENARLEYKVDGDWVNVPWTNGCFIADPGEYRLIKH